MILSMKLLDPVYKHVRPQARHCTICGHHTTGGKDKCGKHVLFTPYAHNVSNLVDRRLKEYERAQDPTRGPKKGDLLVADVFHRLSYEGPATMRRLNKDFELPFHYMKKIIRLLQRLNLVYLRPCGRGGKMVHSVHNPWEQLVQAS